MSRSGYSEDCENLELWRGSVARAIRGKRGQQFLRDLIAALDSLPEKRLISEELEDDGEVCAIGSVAKLRGIDLSGIDPEDHDKLSEKFNIARTLVQETEYINDDDFSCRDETPEIRFERVRKWAVENLREPI